MPWKEETIMSLRTDFVRLALLEERNMSQLCHDFGISRKTAYKWLRRYAAEGSAGLGDRSRRPHHSPGQTAEGVEAIILQVRQEHPCWGGRKIRAWLLRRGGEGLPSPSTITAILRRHGQLDAEESPKHRPFQRFEMEQPNQLWQMDFKGYFLLANGSYCHPLTVPDDYSRFLIGLRACVDQTYPTVQQHLTAMFRHYGLPERMLMDNGSPWGDASSPHTVLTTWLIRLGITVSHGRPRHPQTQGKDERLHRTLQEELLNQFLGADLPTCQCSFDSWRELYNTERPHEALGMCPPISRYQDSPRPFPEQLPPILYDTRDAVRKVDRGGKVSYCNRVCYVGKAFRGCPVAIRPTLDDGLFEVFFCHQRVASIDLRDDNG
jgi:transposase InsO family protein